MEGLYTEDVFQKRVCEVLEERRAKLGNLQNVADAAGVSLALLVMIRSGKAKVSKSLARKLGFKVCYLEQ